MFATLGTIEFEALTGFQEYSLKRGSLYPEHARIDGKPRLQNTGEKLDEITLRIKFNFIFSTPEVGIAALEKARQEAVVLPLTFGNGNFIGNFVIQDTDLSLSQMDSNGNYLDADIVLTLKEAILDDVLSQQDIEAKKAAFASSDNSPSVRTGVFGSLSDAQKANLLLAASQAQAGQLNSDTNQAIKNPSKSNQKFKQVVKNINALVVLLNNAQKIIFGNQGLKTRSDNIFNDIRGSLRACSQLQTAAQARNLTDANTSNQNLQTAMSRLSGSSSMLAGIKVTRKAS